MSSGFRWLLAWWMAWSAVSASAQLTVGLRLGFQTVIPHEPLEMVIILRNETSQDIPIGGEQGITVALQVTESGSRSLPARRSTAGLFPDVLPAHATISVTNQLTRFFEIHNIGDYTALARAEWGRSAFLSKPVFFDLVPGVEVARMVVPLPEEEEQRTYILRLVSRGRIDHLVIRVDDEVNRLCYGAIDLGRIASRERPDMKIDGVGQAHVLFQTSPGQHVYAVCAPEGMLTERRVFGRDYRRASLQVDDVGSIFVQGAPVESGPAVLRSPIEGAPIRRSSP